MANRKPKSKVAKSSKLTRFTFKWWMVIVLVLVVALIGIVIIRLSHASGATYDVHIDDYANNKYFITLYNQGNPIKGTLTVFEIDGGNVVNGKSYPKTTQWKMVLNGGLTACGQLFPKGAKNNLSSPNVNSDVIWVVTNPGCVHG